MRTAKTLIRLGRCPGWSESSLGGHPILLVLSWGGSNLSWPETWLCSHHGRVERLSMDWSCTAVGLKFVSSVFCFYLLLLLTPTWFTWLKLNEILSKSHKTQLQSKINKSYMLGLVMPQKSNTRNNCCDSPKNWTVWFNHGVMLPKDANRSVCSWFTLSYSPFCSVNKNQKWDPLRAMKT